MTESLELVEVSLTTSLGAKYMFPDMPKHVVETLLTENAFLQFGHLSLVNQSMASLILPTRILEVIVVNGEERWRRG